MAGMKPPLGVKGGNGGGIKGRKGFAAPSEPDADDAKPAGKKGMPAFKKGTFKVGKKKK